MAPKSPSSKAGVSAADLQNMTWNPKDGGSFEQIVKKLTTDAAGNSRSFSTTITRVAQPQTDAVLVWNNIALRAIQLDVTDPPVATRNLALVSLALLGAGHPEAVRHVLQLLAAPASVEQLRTTLSVWRRSMLTTAQARSRPLPKATASAVRSSSFSISPAPLGGGGGSGIAILPSAAT